MVGKRLTGSSENPSTGGDADSWDLGFTGALRRLWPPLLPPACPPAPPPALLALSRLDCPPPPAFFRRFISEFQRFLTAFSGRPGSIFAISHQRFPIRSWVASNSASSSGTQGVFFTFTSKWFSHRSRHCFPIRPCSCAAITLHLTLPTPWLMTMYLTMASWEEEAEG